MKELIVVGFLLATTVGIVLALAPRMSEAMVRSKARRLPEKLGARLEEEWLAELGILPGRPSQLAFAIALTLTRRHSFAVDDESLFATSNRSPITIATFGGWPTVVLFTTAVMAAAAYAGSFLIEPLYRSQTNILVVPQRVPTRFAPETTGMSIGDRLRAVRATVLSEARLERTILEFNLYSSERVTTNNRDNVTQRGALPTPTERRRMDAAVERMRRDVTIDPHDDGNTIEVAYISPSPRTAMLVTERLATLVINDNLMNAGVMSESVVAFLDTQIEDVRSRLLNPADTRRGSPSRLHTDVRPVEHDSPESERDDDVRALERELLKQTYRDLLQKKEQAWVAVLMNRQQIGEQFKVLDGARLPEVPISPDRRRLSLLGALVGFCLGIAMMVAGRGGSQRRPKKMLAQS